MRPAIASTINWTTFSVTQCVSVAVLKESIFKTCPSIDEVEIDDAYLKLQGSMQRRMTIISPPAATAVLKGAWRSAYLFNKKVLLGGREALRIWAGVFAVRFDARNF